MNAPATPATPATPAEPDWTGAGGPGEHRTVGPHRAWCYQCGEWCWSYEQGWCPCCDDVRLPGRWRGENVGTVLTDLRRQVTALKHAPACPGEVGCWCPIHVVLDILKTGGSDG